MLKLEDLQVRKLGECTIDSPLVDYVSNRTTTQNYVSEHDRVLFDDTIQLVSARGDLGLHELPSFEAGGPRPKIFHNPAETKVGIVTCGGLCPGLNDVIRALVLELFDHYNVTNVIGFRNGYAGLIPGKAPDPMQLTPEIVGSIAERGGTVLGTSRGSQSVPDMVDTLVDLGVNILFVIGGDGSMRGAHEISEEVHHRGLEIGVVGVPKTIDNDIAFIGTSFGFQTAFAKAAESIKAAKVEVDATYGSVAVVRVMGRHAGFIACYSSLANHDADFVLIPEVKFDLHGPNGLLQSVLNRVIERGNAVLVVGEGAGQELVETDGSRDASGNLKLGDFATLLREKITDKFQRAGVPLILRYFDPGYIIRSVPADAADRVYCTRLAQVAVHAAMAGRTDMVVGRRRHRFVHVPIELVTKNTQRVNADGDLWLSVLESTGQPHNMS